MERGYRPRSVRVQLRLLTDLSGWLVAHDREPVELTVEDVELFLCDRRERVVDLTGARARGPLLSYLRGLGLVPERLGVADTPVERLLAAYRDYLQHERGLVVATVDGLERVARLFLLDRAEPLEDALAQLSAREVTEFVMAQCASGRFVAASAKNVTGGLRSLLRFLHLAGLAGMSRL